MWKPPSGLMRLKDCFCETAGFEQRKAQQYGVAHAAPDCHDDVIFQSDVLHQHSINCHADDDEKRLKAQRQQGAEVVLPHTAPFLAHHRCHRKRRNGCDKQGKNPVPCHIAMAGFRELPSEPDLHLSMYPALQMSV